MIQIFNEENCPDWVKKKCEEAVMTENPKTKESVIYETYHINLKNHVADYYVVRRTDVNQRGIVELLIKLKNSILP